VLGSWWIIAKTSRMKNQVAFLYGCVNSWLSFLFSVMCFDCTLCAITCHCCLSFMFFKLGFVLIVYMFVYLLSCRKGCGCWWDRPFVAWVQHLIDQKRQLYFVIVHQCSCGSWCLWINCLHCLIFLFVLMFVCVLCCYTLLCYHTLIRYLNI